jgi:hypothetical protein
VLTVVFRAYAGLYFLGGNANGGYYICSDLTPFPEELLQERSIPGEFLGNTLTQLFTNFAEQGPGVRRFVRLQHVHFDAFTETVKPHYGPLVAIHPARSEAGAHESLSGASMLSRSYKLARSGERTAHELGAYDVQY